MMVTVSGDGLPSAQSIDLATLRPPGSTAGVTVTLLDKGSTSGEINSALLGPLGRASVGVLGVALSAVNATSTPTVMFAVEVGVPCHCHRLI